MTAALQQTEEQFQDAVLDLAQRAGWLVAHFRSVKVDTVHGPRYMTPVAADGKGFPDLVLVRDHVVYAELKDRRGQLSHEQRVWVDRLRRAGAAVYVWRPSDWDEIEQVLARRGGR